MMKGEYTERERGGVEKRERERERERDREGTEKRERVTYRVATHAKK